MQTRWLKGDFFGDFLTGDDNDWSTGQTVKLTACRPPRLQAAKYSPLGVEESSLGRKAGALTPANRPRYGPGTLCAPLRGSNGDIVLSPCQDLLVIIAEKRRDAFIGWSGRMERSGGGGLSRLPRKFPFNEGAHFIICVIKRNTTPLHTSSPFLCNNQRRRTLLLTAPPSSRFNIRLCLNMSQFYGFNRYGWKYS